MSLQKLPPVAKSFVTFCSKCQGDKFHTVITHLTTDSAKIVCDICKKKSTFKLIKTKVTLNPARPRVARAVGEKISFGAKKETQQHSEIYQGWLNKYGQLEAIPFSVKNQFKLHQKIQHSKFGFGFVTRVLDDRVEVIFADEVRLLVHQK